MKNHYNFPPFSLIEMQISERREEMPQQRAFVWLHCVMKTKHLLTAPAVPRLTAFTITAWRRSTLPTARPHPLNQSPAPLMSIFVRLFLCFPRAQRGPSLWRRAWKRSSNSSEPSSRRRSRPLGPCSSSLRRPSSS